MNQEQILRQQGWSEENIERLRVINSNPEAHQHALKTGDLNSAYEMALPKNKPVSSIINDLIVLFSKERPSDAESLSIALTEFSEFVQKSLDKKKAP